MYYFCTYFDRNYLTKGLALYRSLERYSRPFVLWILCFDEETYHILGELDLPHVRRISQADFEAGDYELVATKEDRTLVEYYWTCTPSLPLYVLRTEPDVDVITYLDADLYFFSSPQSIFDELGDQSILIVGHRFAPRDAKLADRFGIYNVGLLTFRRDEAATACLEWWRARCIEWCYHREEDGKIGDQKYLDDWPERFKGVAVLQHPGGGLAGYNITNHTITRRDGRIWVNNQPLVFYHFQLFRQYTRRMYYFYYRRVSSAQRRWIYEPYLKALNSAASAVRKIRPDFQEVKADYPLRLIMRDIYEGRADILHGTYYTQAMKILSRSMFRWYWAARSRFPLKTLMRRVVG